MRIEAKQMGRKFGHEWIFRNFSFSFEAGGKYALVGNNGSGKSTLLKVLSASLLPSEGQLLFSDAQGLRVEADAIYKDIALVGPYTAVIEELTLQELLVFVSKFKPFALPLPALMDQLRLTHARNKPIQFFSSGMKQRLQLGLAFLGPSRILLLDEPTSNLDKENTHWYLELVEQPLPQRIVVISSNQPHEYACTQAQLHLADYKMG